MRWQEPKLGDTRIQTKFLLLPLTIGYETRWLERASWKEVYHSSGLWLPIKWMEVN